MVKPEMIMCYPWISNDAYDDRGVRDRSDIVRNRSNFLAESRDKLIHAILRIDVLQAKRRLILGALIPARECLLPAKRQKRNKVKRTLYLIDWLISVSCSLQLVLITSRVVPMSFLYFQNNGYR